MTVVNNSGLFKSSSTTYYYSSLFFSKKIFSQVNDLYVFVRKADNFVDLFPQAEKKLNNLFKNTLYLFKNKISNQKKYDSYIINFVKLAKRKKFKVEWINAFFNSMKTDLQKNQQWIIYKTEREIDRYIYGSAQTIGLMMAKILDLDSKSFVYARMLGSAMQQINFIRDIKEDCILKRQYFPQSVLRKFNLKNLCQINLHDIEQTKNFFEFVRYEIEIYREKQNFAEKGYSYIPYRHLIPIKTASDLYKWTADKIYKNPLLIFKEKVKPSKLVIIMNLLKNVFVCLKY